MQFSKHLLAGGGGPMTANMARSIQFRPILLIVPIFTEG